MFSFYMQMFGKNHDMELKVGYVFLQWNKEPECFVAKNILGVTYVGTITGYIVFTLCWPKSP